jgi:hypothetical protein
MASHDNKERSGGGAEAGEGKALHLVARQQNFEKLIEIIGEMVWVLELSWQLNWQRVSETQLMIRRIRTEEIPEKRGFRREDPCRKG